MRPTRRLQAAVALACAGVVLTGCSAKKKDAADPAATASTSADVSVASSDASSSDSDFDITLVPATPGPDDETSTGDTAEPSSSSSPVVKPTAKPTPTTVPSPSSTPPIAAGRVFAFIKKIDVAGRLLTYDQAQFLTGDAAVKAAAEDKQTLDTDYYIRNVNKKLRTAPIAPDAAILGTLPLTDQVDPTPVTLDAVAAFVGTEIGASVGFWVTIDGKGRITKIEEQYVP